ncbi:MAG TPA: PIG-L family deacetylase [Myxococcales bacterium]|nr:PIG-L family deacetylase [Myxococcales bacterium]
MTLLVVSPHLDDAVLSVPVRLRRRASTGDRVILATVFSEGADGARRRREDHAAARRLGVEPMHLGLPDAPERRGLPRSARALLRATTEPDVPNVAGLLQALVHAVKPTEIWLPLGVGEHVDHRVVHAAGLSLAPSLAFYEDRPYANVRHSTAARLRRLGVVSVHRPPTSELVASALRAPFASAYLPAGEDGAALLREIAELPEAPPAWTSRGDVIEPDKAEIEGVLPAVSAYASQLPDLFGGRDLRSVLADADGVYRERLHDLWPLGQP